MTLSPYFNDELSRVDPRRSFTWSIDTSWNENEFRVDGWHITGGSIHGLRMGGCEALYRLGYRFYSPLPRHIYRPPSLPAGGVSIPRHKYLVPYCSFSTSMWHNAAEQAAIHRYRMLNSILDEPARRRIVHCWHQLVNEIDAVDRFFINNPQYIELIGEVEKSFRIRTHSYWEPMATRIAQHLASKMLAGGYTEHTFDPNDSSPYNTEDVFGFSNLVAAKVRERVPTATLGVYAYGSGRVVPPPFDCPHLFVQITLGFGSAGYTWNQLIDMWAPKVHAIGVYAYANVSLWERFIPMMSNFDRSTGMEAAGNNYKQFFAAGVDQVVVETGGDWIVQLVSHARAMRYFRYGDVSYEETVDEVVRLIFDGDQAVGDLYRYWGRNVASPQTFRRSADFVDAMRPGSWWKDSFQSLMAFVYQWRHQRTFPYPSPMLIFEREKAARWAQGLIPDGVYASGVHSQFMRSRVPGVSQWRPDLEYYGREPAAHYRRFPYRPTKEDYEFTRDRSVVVSSDRPPEYEDMEDLVLVRTTPAGGVANYGAMRRMLLRNVPAEIYVLGPGTVTTTPTLGDPVPRIREFDAGLSKLELSGSTGMNMTWTVPALFVRADLDCPMINVTGITLADSLFYFAYVPNFVAGRSIIHSNMETYIYDRTKSQAIGPGYYPFVHRNSGAPQSDPRRISTGVVALRAHLLSNNGFRFVNIFPFVSTRKDLMLVPRAAAEREWPGRFAIG